MSTGLRFSIHAVLILAILIDVSLWGMTLLAPNWWFETLHGDADVARSITLLRRAGGHWLAFLVFQTLALALWRRQPLWLVLIAGVRFSDLFTDLTYLIDADSLTTLGVVSLALPPPLNLGMGLLMLYGFARTDPGKRSAPDRARG